MWDLEVYPIIHAHKIIVHIDEKRQALGIEKARDRILVDMAARRNLETAYAYEQFGCHWFFEAK